jgi:myo-inositol catabolism protein IolC
MTLGYDRPLYMLAFDHRASFSKNLLGIVGTPNAADADRVTDAKLVIYDAFERATANGVSAATAGLLVEEEFGADVARCAGSNGFTLAMPVEKSGQKAFDFEFGEEFGRHIEAFDPAFAKVLVRYNPEGDASLNAAQADRLRRLSDWLHLRKRKLLFELLVPAEPHQLTAAGSQDAYDRSVRPRLVVETMRELQDAGVEPDVWKIEGFDGRDDCVTAAAQARAGGRSGVACIVLGRGADDGRVVHWLEQAASVPGFVGFAIGRTLWWSELVAYVADELDRDTAARRIADNYHRMIDAYERCAA